ncbi:MAG: VWA domain-containing protein [Candidatus Omnitrophota bacterium]|nr:VWA domain-containing protein [Candidatus Omnitrophota bacterium]
MEFRHPYFFLLLLLIPVLLYFSRKRRAVSMSFSTTVPFEGQVWSLRLLMYRFLPLLRAVSLILFVVALARPQDVTAEREYQTKGVDIVVALDISGSMLAEDFKPENRLSVAKQEAIKFIRGRENDRMGLVVFARKAFTQCPLTLDYDVLTSLLKEVRIGMIPDGTAIGMGLATAVNRLRSSEAKSKVIILLTDGENNAGNIDPITAAELAKTFNIKAYTIGVGRGGLVPFPVNDPLFGKRYVQANVEIDEMTLKRIADITGGVFFRARDPQSLSEIYEKINQLETTEVKVKEYRSYDELFGYLLLPALLLLLIELLLANTLLLKVP